MPRFVEDFVEDFVEVLKLDKRSLTRFTLLHAFMSPFALPAMHQIIKTRG